MLLHSASQLLTLAGEPQRGTDLGRLGMIENGALLVRVAGQVRRFHSGDVSLRPVTP